MSADKDIARQARSNKQTDLDEWFLKHLKKMYKRYYDKGLTVGLLHSRVYQSAYSILEKIVNINEEALSLQLYMMIKDTEFANFAHRYEYVLRIAKEKPDTFIEQLYKFYDEMATFIKKNNYYSRFFEFLSFFQNREIDEESENRNIYYSYVNLLLEQLEFLRANKFDLNKTVAGLSTDNKIIEINDPYPYLDVPAYELSRFIVNNRSSEITFSMLKSLYSKYGYKINSEEDVEILKITCQIYSNTIAFMTPYINEFTEDILPHQAFDVVYSDYKFSIPAFVSSSESLKDILLHRKKTIAANGLKVHFENSKFTNDILIKEIFHNNAVICLYRLETKRGETSGFYNTKTRQFASVFIHTFDSEGMAEYIENTILWAYAAYVCDNEKVLPTAQSYNEYLQDEDVEISFTAIGGKLRVPTETKHIRTIAGNDNYETDIRHINGYIRKLPNGQKASDRAVAIAEALGYELATDETYVQPFERTSWITKKENK